MRSRGCSMIFGGERIKIGRRCTCIRRPLGGKSRKNRKTYATYVCCKKYFLCLIFPRIFSYVHISSISVLSVYVLYIPFTYSYSYSLYFILYFSFSLLKVRKNWFIGEKFRFTVIYIFPHNFLSCYYWIIGFGVWV